MADKSISELGEATRVFVNDLFVLSQDNVAKRMSGQTLRNSLLEWLDGHGGIKRIAKTGSSGNPVVDTYTITYADDSTSTYTVTNGAKGDTAYWYVHIRYSDNQPTRDADMKTTPSNWMGIYSGSNATAPTTYTSYQWYRIRGDTGVGISSIAQNQDYSFTISMDDGTSYNTAPLKGLDGAHVTSISTQQQMIPGTTRTWTMAFSDNTSFDFSVYDGANGDGAGDMTKSVYDTNNREQDIFNYTDNAVATRAAAVHNHTMSNITDYAPPVVVEGNASSVSGLSLTYATINTHVTEGKLPIVIVDTAIYVYSYRASNKIFFANIATLNSPIIYYLQLTNGNVVTSGNYMIAQINSPGFTGTPTAPTASTGTSTTQIATTAFVQNEKEIANGICGLDADQKIDPKHLYSDVVFVSGTSITLGTSHAGKSVFTQANDPSAVVITIPTDSDAGWDGKIEIEVCKYGTGNVTFAADTGVTLHSEDAKVELKKQYGTVGLKRIAANEWLLNGHIE